MLYYQYSIWFDSDRACIRFSGKTTKGMGFFLVCWHHHDYTILMEFWLGKIPARFKQMHTHTIVVLSHSRRMNETLRLWQCKTHLKVMLCHHTHGATCSFLPIFCYPKYHFNIILYMIIYDSINKKSADLTGHLHSSETRGSTFPPGKVGVSSFPTHPPDLPGFRPFAERRVKPQPVTCLSWLIFLGWKGGICYCSYQEGYNIYISYIYMVYIYIYIIYKACFIEIRSCRLFLIGWQWACWWEAGY